MSWLVVRSLKNRYLNWKTKQAQAQYKYRIGLVARAVLEAHREDNVGIRRRILYKMPGVQEWEMECGGLRMGYIKLRMHDGYEIFETELFCSEVVMKAILSVARRVRKVEKEKLNRWGREK